MIAVPKRPRPHQHKLEQPRPLESLKERLIQHVLRGDHQSAEAVRAEICLLRAQQIAARESAAHEERGTCTAQWVVDHRVVEEVELTATPEARQWFDAGQPWN